MSDFLARLKRAQKEVKPRTTANRQELARILSVTEPTVDRLRRDNDGFPVKLKGGHGVAYVYNVRSVLTFLIKRFEADEKSEALRQAQIGQVSLDLAGGETTGVPEGLSLKDQKLALEVLAVARRELEAQGQLYKREDVDRFLDEMVLQVAGFFRNLPGQIDHEGLLTPEQLERLGEQVKDLQIRLHNMLEEFNGTFAAKRAGSR